MRRNMLRDQMWGERCRELAGLLVFALVDAAALVLADPLAPAVELEPVARLLARQIGVADEPQVGLGAGVRQRLGETVDAGGQAAYAGVRVGTFEGNDVELHPIRRRPPR